MYLRQINIVKSPTDQDKIRLVGEVIYDNQIFESELYWFEVHKDYREYISTSGNLWLICLLPLAMTINEPLRINLPVDANLLNNIKRLMTIWKCWHKNLNTVHLDIDSCKNIVGKSIDKTAIFFSGGVDSFFSLLQNEEQIDDLITVYGFDIPLNNSAEFQKMFYSLKNVATNLNKNLIQITTNIRNTLWSKTDWGYLSHGCALAAVALSLEKRFQKVLISSTGGYNDLKPWGSHVLADPLFSTNTTSFIHDGAEFNRLEKVKFIANRSIAHDALHVCWKIGSAHNCSNCMKCYRTMIALDLLGALGKFRTFDYNKYSVNKIGMMYMNDSYEHIYMNESLQLASQIGRNDVVKAIDKSFSNSQKLKRYMPIAKKISNWLSKRQFIWRWSDLPTKLLLGNSIT